MTKPDVVTATESTSTFDDGELKSLIASVEKLQSLEGTDSVRSYVIQSSTRIMNRITYERFFNFFGFYGARLSNGQSVRGPSNKKRSFLITLISPTLFYAPEEHLKELEKVWVDRVVKHRHWNEFQRKIEREWEEFILYATVVMNANAAFLAIPSVLTNEFEDRLMMSPTAVISQLSAVFSLGSIIIGLLLLRQMRIGAKDSAEDHLAFLMRRTHPRLGVETLAILFSLPYALLMWAMTTFLAAVVVNCFFDLGGNPKLSEQIACAVVWFFDLVLIVWTIRVGWQKRWRFRLREILARFASISSPDSGESIKETTQEDTAPDSLVQPTHDTAAAPSINDSSKSE